MSEKKRTLLFIALSAYITLTILLFGLFGESYNKTPDLSGKKPDSGLHYAEYQIPVSIEDLTARADAVLTGTVTASDQSSAEIRTEAVLAGTAPETLLLRQTSVGKDREPIVHNEERLLLILQKQGERYKTSANGVFILDSDDRLTSLSPFIICARYDGLHLRTFERDLKESYFYSAIGGSDEERKALAEQYRNDEAFRQKRLDEWNDLTGGKPIDYEYAVIDSFFD